MSAFLTSVAVPNKTQYQSPSKNLNIVEEKYLNYTIEQNTKYSDIDRIQEKYLNLAIKKGFSNRFFLLLFTILTLTVK